MSKSARVVIVVLAIVLGVILGLTQAENKRYSYKA